MKLFVYGTLAPGKPNEHILAPLGGRWTEASVKGELKQQGWGADLGFPGIVLNPNGNTVQGMLLEAPALEQHWHSLDAFEGNAYQRVETEVQLTNGEVTVAYIYALNGEV